MDDEAFHDEAFYVEAGGARRAGEAATAAAVGEAASKSTVEAAGAFAAFHDDAFYEEVAIRMGKEADEEAGTLEMFGAEPVSNLKPRPTSRSVSACWDLHPSLSRRDVRAKLAVSTAIKGCGLQHGDIQHALRRRRVCGY